MARVAAVVPEFMTNGEKSALAELRKLPKEWGVIANKLLVQRNAETKEVDFIVIGRKNIFAIEEKAWEGRFRRGNQRFWIRDDGEQRNSPLNSINLKAKVLRGQLDDAIENLKNVKVHFVHSLVLLTNISQPPQIDDDPRVATQVMLLEDVLRRLKSIDAGNGNLAVGLNQTKIWNWLGGLPARKKFPDQIGSYTLINEIDNRPAIRIFTAKYELGGDRVLTICELEHKDAQPRSFYENEWRALSRLSETGVVPRVYDTFYEQDLGLLIMPSDPPSGEAIGVIDKPNTRTEAIEELERARSAFIGLQKIHDHDVIHRALTPQAVNFSNRNGINSVTLANFFAAKSDVGTISHWLDDLPITDPYTAPELRRGYGSADSRSDTYSMALMFMERLYAVPITELVSSGTEIYVPPESRIDEWFDDHIASLLREFFETALDRTSGIGLDAQECLTKIGNVIGLVNGDLEQKTESVRLKRDNEDGESADNDSIPQQDPVVPPGTTKSPVAMLAKGLGIDLGRVVLVDGHCQRENQTLWLQLNEHSDSDSWTRVPVSGVSIGRADDNEIKLQDLSVSRHHAKIQNVDGAYKISDMGSMNGTFVDGKRVEDGVVLQESSEFIVGDATIQAHLNTLSRAYDWISMMEGAVWGEFSAVNLLLFRILNGSQEGTSYLIGEAGATIGRARDNDIVVSDRLISRHHGWITYEWNPATRDSCYCIEDLVSKNGTYINGRRVPIYYSPVRLGGREGRRKNQVRTVVDAMPTIELIPWIELSMGDMKIQLDHLQVVNSATC